MNQRWNGSLLRAGLAVGLACGTGWAQQPAKRQPVPVAPRVAPQAAMEQPNAGHVRDEFQRLVGQYPPTVRQVLAIDPELLGNEGYLSQYPALAGFLAAHPEVARNGAFYAGEPQRYGVRQQFNSSSFMSEVFRGVSLLIVFSLVIGVLAWLIRTLVDYRRWNRLTSIQTDVHTKLLDRFTSNDDMLAYIQSPAGSKFLESSPILLDAGPKQISAPLGRILWSLQSGVVLSAAGIGVLSLSVDAEVQHIVSGFGLLSVALGIGFILSSGVSYMISRRLGLITPVKRTGEE